jgi:hypothetical protein
MVRPESDNAGKELVLVITYTKLLLAATGEEIRVEVAE